MLLWLSLSLSLFVSLLSLSFTLALSLSFPFHVLWLGALSFPACFLYTVHSLCVLIAAILGEGENDEEDLAESSRARFCGTTQRGATGTWSAWRAGGRYTCFSSFSLFSPSALPPVRPLSLSLSLSLCSPLLLLGENSCCTACAQASHLTCPTYPINHGTLLTTVCLCGCKCARKRETLWVNDFETIYPGRPGATIAAIMLDNPW